MNQNDRTRSTGRFCRMLLAACFLMGLVSGCAGNKGVVSGEPVFFPPPPDDPRIQYLTGISDSSDITGLQSNFSLVLTGGEKADVIRGVGKAFGITTHKGKIYIAATTSGQVIVIDIANKTFEYLKGAIGPGALKKPVSVALDDDDNIYVADTGRKEIVVYNAAGNFVKSFGKESEKSKLVGIVASGPNLYAIDNRANEIKVFDRKTRELVTTFGKSEDANAMSLPSYIAADADGNLYTTNIGSGKILKYDRDGHLLSAFGKFGDSFGEFARPRGIAVDGSGLIYVVDAGHQNVQIFNKEGRILTFFGNPGLPAGSLNLPAGIAVTKDNLEYFQKFAAPGFRLENVIFVVCQYGKPSISVFGYGAMEGKKGSSAGTKDPKSEK
ncbi:hypothetical protein [Geobacter sp. AOG2]|uniref:hypothetical protein n=1 Tax=Geobacter sp. AOG2 TaxID=1566347 RepID=UPI001CC4CFD2|nr:hypothetical protein [Geobacter sp. AOG2]GFE62106.1 hypothetical protein AOG2_26940 [Geobacter sp. AOG2]